MQNVGEGLGILVSIYRRRILKDRHRRGLDRCRLHGKVKGDSIFESRPRLKARPYHDAIRKEPEPLPWEKWQPDASFDQFVCISLEILDFARSRLHSLWHFSSLSRYWKKKPELSRLKKGETVAELQPAERIAYFTLLKGFAVNETVAVVLAWFAHHDVELTTEQMDQIEAMVFGKSKYGKSAKAIRAATRTRREKNTQKVGAWRDAKRKKEGGEPRLSRNHVYSLLPKTRNGKGDDLDDWTDNQERYPDGTLEYLAQVLGFDKEAVRSHLRRLEEKGWIRKTSEGTYFRQTEPDGYPKPFK
jgi:hypothetical protein